MHAGCYLTAGNRRPSDMDAESGIETGDSDSASASVTSSEYASLRRDNTTAVNVDTAVTPDMTSCPDDVGEFIRLMMVQLPPSPVALDESDVVVVPPPTDMVDYGSDPPLHSDYSPYTQLPPLLELPEDDATTSMMTLQDENLADSVPCDPRQTSSVDNDLTPSTAAAHPQRKVDENSNRVLASADGVVAANKHSCPPVPAKRCVNTTMFNSVNHGVDVAVLSTSMTTENTTLTQTSTAAPPVSVADNTSGESRTAQIRYSGDTETLSNSHKKTPTTNIWKRFLKRDVKSDDVSSSLGNSWSLFPRRKSVPVQSSSDAESIMTLPRRPKTPSQSKAAGKSRDLYISLPFDFRDLTTNVGLTQAASDEEQLNSTGRREFNESGMLSVGQKSNDSENVSLASNDDVPPAADNVSSNSSSSGISWSLFPHRKTMTVTVQSSSIAESTATLRRQPKNSKQSKSKVAAKAAKARDISVPFDFRNIGQTPEQRTTSDDERLSLTGCREVSEDGGSRSGGRESNDNEEMSSASGDDLAEGESLEMHDKTMRSYRDEQGHLFNVATVPRIFNASSLACLPSINDEKRNSLKNARNSPTPVQSSQSPASGRRLSLMSLGATLPRLHKRTQSSNDDQSASSYRWSDPATTGLNVDGHDDDLSEVKRSEYLQTSKAATTRPSPAAETNQLLRRSMTEQPPPTPPLFLLFDSILTLEDDSQPQQTVASGRFDTFRGALKPMRWAEEDPGTTSTKRSRSLSAGNRSSACQQIPAFVNVRPPPSFLAAVTDVPSTAAPVAAPCLVHISAKRDKQRSEKLQKVKLYKSQGHLSTD